MLWLLISSASYFLTAITSITDKFLVSKKMPTPAVYSFFVGLLSISAVMFIPFGFFIPSLKIILIAFLSGFAFIFSLFCFYSALSKNEASRVVTLAGALVPLFSLLFGFLLLSEKLTPSYLWAFGFLLVGGILISLHEENFSWKIRGFYFIIFSALFLALSFVLAKFVYLDQGFIGIWSKNQIFINGYIWTRIGGFLAAFVFLIPSSSRKLIMKTSKSAGLKTSSLLVGNKALGGLAFILLNYAFTLNSISLINALQGLQYVFLFGLAFLLSRKYPSILKEEISKKVIAQKITAILLIGIGLGILAL